MHVCVVRVVELLEVLHGEGDGALGRLLLAQDEPLERDERPLILIRTRTARRVGVLIRHLHLLAGHSRSCARGR